MLTRVAWTLRTAGRHGVTLQTQLLSHVTLKEIPMAATSLIRLFALVLALISLPSLASAQADRGGFTLLLNGGLGAQADTEIDDAALGLSGLNLGLGGFVAPKLAVLGRFSGTNVNYDLFEQSSGVWGATVQYWARDRAAIEVGAGFGYWRAEGFDDTGFGLILGTHFTIVNRGKHNFQAGLEYAPAFTTNPVHNIGITFGYQFF
jgi:hypothetical protein